MSDKVEATFHHLTPSDQAQTQIDRDHARDEVDRLTATLDRVRAEHPNDHKGWCDGCGYGWPCATTRALDGEAGQ